MKTILILCLLVAVVVARPADDTYNPKYDSFDAVELVKNKRLLKTYGTCFLDKGPCTAEGADFKKIIPEALRTTCAKCSPKQRKLVRIVVKGFQSDLPDIWNELVKKEDPKGEFKENFDKFLASAE